jgi:hypothetical protein
MNQSDYLFGSFDINSQIPNNGDYVTPYDITSASYSFYFSDDGEKVYDHYDYDYYSSGGDYYYSYYYYYNDDREGAFLNIEGQTHQDYTDYYSIPPRLINSWRETRDCNWIGQCTYNYYREYEVITGYSHGISLNQGLNPIALSQLSDDGIANFYISANYGDLYYEYGRLTVTINENPIPIPGAVWLLGSGLIGLVAIRRKFKK